MQDGIELDADCFAGNEGHEYDTDISDNHSDSGDIDDEMYMWVPCHTQDMTYSK